MHAQLNERSASVSQALAGFKSLEEPSCSGGIGLPERSVTSPPFSLECMPSVVCLDRRPARVITA